VVPADMHKAMGDKPPNLPLHDLLRMKKHRIGHSTGKYADIEDDEEKYIDF
jgi:hypothetical protein